MFTENGLYVSVTVFELTQDFHQQTFHLGVRERADPFD
jgi:hypothetical protein